MQKIICLFMLLLVSNINHAQWIKTDFTDAAVLLCSDFSGSNGAIGGWHFPIALVNAYYTTDNGSSWQTAQTPDSLRVIVDMQMMNDNLIYGCGAKNKVDPVITEPIDYRNIASDKMKRLLFKKGILGKSINDLYRGQFLQSTNGGQSWQYKGNIPDSVAYLIDLEFISITTGYTLTHNDSSSGLMKTTDGGSTWNWAFEADPGTGIYAFSFLDSLKGFIVGASGSGGTVFKTTNAGVSWQSIIIPDMLELNNIKCIAADKIIISGLSNAFANKAFLSTDQGSTWNIVLSLENSFIDGVDGLPGGWTIAYGTLFPTGSSTPFVYGTTNNGQTWVETTLSPLTDLIFTSSKMTDHSRWYITGTKMISEGFLLHTINSGGLPVELTSFTAVQSGENIQLDWSTSSEKNNFGFEVERRTAETHFAAIGFVKGRGTTTERQNYSLTDKPGYLDQTLIYRLKQVDYDGTFEYSNEVKVENPARTEFSLLQNYPNPFNPSTTISFDLPVSSNITLKVFDVLGQEVSVLIQGYKNAGRYEIVYDAKDDPGGIYFYELRTENSLLTKKMILLR